MYFSRAFIPYNRDNDALPTAYQHIGIYAYRAAFVGEYCSWQSCDLEEIERLEQLRILYHGQRICVYQAADLPGRGVDTQEDLDYVRDFFAQRDKKGHDGED